MTSNAKLSDTWPQALSNASAIAEHIERFTAGHEVDVEFIEEHFFGMGAHLESVPIDQIEEGPADSHMADKKKEKSYARLSLATMPPIVIENNIVCDGNHRLRAARALGAKSIWCYIVVVEDLVAECGLSTSKKSLSR